MAAKRGYDVPLGLRHTRRVLIQAVGGSWSVSKPQRMFKPPHGRGFTPCTRFDRRMTGRKVHPVDPLPPWSCKGYDCWTLFFATSKFGDLSDLLLAGVL